MNNIYKIIHSDDFKTGLHQGLNFVLRAYETKLFWFMCSYIASIVM